MKMVDARLARTLEDLSEFKYNFEYVPGRLNWVADGLSRLPILLDVYESAVEELPAGLVVDGPLPPGGGDSLFISLLTALRRAEAENLPLSHIDLRRLLIGELMEHPGRYGLVTIDKIKKQDLRLMMHPGQLSALEALLVASRLFKMVILFF